MNSRQFAGDPALSFHLYCDGRLDQVITHLVTNLSGRLGKIYGDAYQGLWFLRYSFRGEHLKVRIHAEAPVAELLAETQLLADSFLASYLPVSKGIRKGPGRYRPVPVDLEDRAKIDHPDCSFQVCNYQRSEVHFGPNPWPQDDLHVARTCAALTAASEFICDLARGFEGDWPHKFRQATLWKLVIPALRHFAGDVPRLRSYLTYHRHWLVQYVANGSSRNNQIFLALLDQSWINLGTSLAPIEKKVTAEWLEASEPEPALIRWVGAIGALIEQAKTHSGDPDYRVDPIASEVSFAPLFKVLHGVANQLGLLQRDEALSYFILLGCLDAAVQTENLQPTGNSNKNNALRDSHVNTARDSSAEGQTNDTAEADWLELIRISGSDGERWVYDFVAFGYETLRQQTHLALNLLQQKRLDEGRAILVEVEIRLTERSSEEVELAMPEKAMLETAWRVYWGVLAYYHYARNEYLLAELCLDRAHLAIENAIAQGSCTWSQAKFCLEFLFHKIRISRNRKNWSEMKERIEQARQICESAVPLCIPTGQKALYFEDFFAAMKAIPKSPETDRYLSPSLTDEAAHKVWAENFIEGILLIPGTVIAYP